jgi:hypothetical protein
MKGVLHEKADGFMGGFGGGGVGWDGCGSGAYNNP